MMGSLSLTTDEDAVRVSVNSHDTGQQWLTIYLSDEAFSISLPGYDRDCAQFARNLGRSLLERADEIDPDTKEAVSG